MMAKVNYEVTAVVGKYTDKEGKEKNRYQRIGSIIETKNGPMLKLDNIPIIENGWAGWAYLNPPKPRDDVAPKQHRDEFNQEDDRIPF
jgi:hypothetical protein